MKTLILATLLITTSSLTGQTKRFYYNHNRTPKFMYATQVRENIGGGFSERVLQLFQKADSNNDNKITAGELQIFQYALVLNFRYKQNKTALHPNDFVAQGGGDCEDFALMTTCMLNYYGIVAYVAMFGRVTTNKHSLCMVKTQKPVPPGYLYYTLNGWNAPKGTYIPVDYDKIGGLKAIDRRWKIARMVKPIDIFGAIW
jgi:hypothetical protein